jgi:hypothetical protein
MRSAALALALVLLPATALAQDKARAEALFQDAKALMAKGDFAGACPKLARSQALDPAVGTLLNLATCYEHAGKSASAWASYMQAAAAARNAGQSDREKFAREHAQALAPNLGMVTVSVATTPGLEVRIDGTLIEQAEWGVALPYDAGHHRVEATATGKKKWASTVDVKDGAKADVSVPALEDSEPPKTTPKPEVTPLIPPSTKPSPLPPPPSTPTEKKGPWIAVGIAGVAVGAVGIGIGSIFGVMALDSKSTLDAMCPSRDRCPASQKGTIDDLSTRATVSTIGFVAGGVLLAVGGTALATSLFGKSSKVQASAHGIEVRF